ncbi:MAG TPA: hypothetical protein VGG39_37890 [Polyangiaceae bacterium]|jgi:hypothetical protein
MSSEFWKTEIGQRMLDTTLPALVEQLKRIAEALEALILMLAKQNLEG